MPILNDFTCNIFISVIQSQICRNIILKHQLYFQIEQHIKPAEVPEPETNIKYR